MSMPNYKRTKFSCYFLYLSAASVFALPPMLFTTFNEDYGISYTLLGTLVLVNFCTQLSIDLLFSFFAKYFNIKATVRLMPVLTALGLLVYASSPWLFKGNEYIGLLTGTVLFSLAAGLGEVLLSPIIAAIPSEHPERDMSILHSLYAWGVLSVVIVSTLFFNIFGRHNWMYLTMYFAALSLISCVLFIFSPIPPMELGHPDTTKQTSTKSRTVGLALCTACIFLGGASENVMTNWISGYVEKALGVSKQYGDILGLAVFAILLGTGRILYAKYGKNIINTLILGMLGAIICYLTAGIVNVPAVALIACILTGFATSMLWPGTLILMEEKIPHPTVAAYALMAAGGDFGSSISPQLVGIIVDKVSASDFALRISNTAGIPTDQIGLKVGMLITVLFPFLGLIVVLCIKKYFTKNSTK